MRHMRRFAHFLAVAAIAASPLHAQEAADDDGISLLEEGAKLFFRGIMEEMEPAMKDLQGLADNMEPALREFVEEMGPALGELAGKIGDLNAYHPPEVLPNGDIILRRKTPKEPDPDGDIEL